MTEVRTFADYSVYKGKAALSVKPIPPTFAVSGSTRVVTRNGGMLFEAAAASGIREYDWSNKLSFRLDVVECGDLLEKVGQGDGIDLLHDPNMGGPLAGQVVKKLKMVPMQDGKGMFLSMQVTDKSASAPVSVNVPLSWAEIQVIKCLIDYSIP
jgi:hypothetical protein